MCVSLNRLIVLHNDADANFEKDARETLATMDGPSIERATVYALLGSDFRAKQDYDVAAHWQKLVIRDLELLGENVEDQATIKRLLAEAKEDLQLTQRTWGSRFPARSQFPLITTYAR